MIHAYRSLRLKWKLMIPFGLLTVVWAASGTFLLARTAVGRAQSRMDTELEQKMRRSGTIIADLVAGNIELVRLAANTEGVAEAVLAADLPALERLLRPLLANSRADAMTVLDVAGAEALALWRTGAEVVSGPLTLPPQIAGSLGGQAGAPAGKRVLLTSSAQGSILLAAGPVRDGVTPIASLGVATLARTLADRLGNAEGAAVALYDRRGTMVTASAPVPALEPSAVAGSGQLRLQAGGQEVLVGSIVGRGEVVARVGVFREPGSLLDELGMTPAWLAVLGMLAILGVVGLGLLVARTITAPLDRVATTARGIAEGELSQRAEVRSGDEIGTLGSAFNAMADRLQESYEVLERRVRERTAQLLDANAELARVAQAKSEFLASISHELRTPLNAILGYSEILSDPYFPAPGPEEVTKYAEAIHESGRHLLNLINDLLDLSKIEAGKLELHLEPVALAGSVGEVLRVIEPLAASKCLLVSSDLREAPEMVLTDERRLRQILLNLLSNAVKFTPEGGSVELRASSEGGNLLVSVTDTGVGIDPGHQDKIFDPFCQADAGYARNHEGTGLGLALTKELVELHGGRIWVVSEKCKGSRFAFTIPAGTSTESAITNGSEVSWPTPC